jgi:hypothetical protein
VIYIEHHERRNNRWLANASVESATFAPTKEHAAYVSGRSHMIFLTPLHYYARYPCAAVLRPIIKKRIVQSERAAR